MSASIVPGFTGMQSFHQGLLQDTREVDPFLFRHRVQPLRNGQQIARKEAGRTSSLSHPLLYCLCRPASA